MTLRSHREDATLAWVDVYLQLDMVGNDACTFGIGDEISPDPGEAHRPVWPLQPACFDVRRASCRTRLARVRHS